jgi:hypothetical protein
MSTSRNRRISVVGIYGRLLVWKGDSSSSRESESWKDFIQACSDAGIVIDEEACAIVLPPGSD